MDFIKAKGKKTYIGNEEILLKGVGLGGWLMPEGYMWGLGGKIDRPRRIERMISELCDEEYCHYFFKEYERTYITEEDFAWIKQQGFNSIRLPFNCRHLLNGEKFNEEYLANIDNAVTWAKKYGLFVFLDCHAAPGGQTGQNIDDSEDDYPSLFGNEDYENKLIHLWSMLANRYKDEPCVGGYDILNEPIRSDFISLSPLLLPLYRRVIASIREVDKNHLIILEGTHWDTDLSVLEGLTEEEFKDNLVFEFHKYWNAPDKKSLASFLEFRDRHNVPLWDGESGENNLYWYSLLFPLLEREDIGWSFWTYRKMGNSNSLSSFEEPAGWEQIKKYSLGGAVPIEPKELFDSFLKSLLRPVFHEKTVNAIFARAPCSIAGEGYEEIHTTSVKTKGSSFREDEPGLILFKDAHMGLPDFKKMAGEPQLSKDTMVLSLNEGDEAIYRFSSLAKNVYLSIDHTGDISEMIDWELLPRNGVAFLNPNIQNHFITIRCTHGVALISSLNLEVAI